MNTHTKLDLTKPIYVNNTKTNIYYFPNFIEKQSSQHIFKTLYKETKWNQDSIKVYGKVYPQPRLTHLFANNNKTYKYSNITMTPSIFPKEILQIKSQIDTLTNLDFTTCLANLYRDGSDSNGWHADNEKELGPDPIIASVSLGAARWFHLKHKKDKTLKTKILLEDGSLLLMKEGTQTDWLHQIPKTKKVIEPRINLTFRIIK